MLEKPVIIFDTDMDTDCDDMGALALMLDYHKRGMCELAGIVVDAPCRGGALACELLCNYAGVKCDIGTVYEDDYKYEESERYRRYRDHRLTLSEDIFYNRKFVEMAGKDDKCFPSAVKTYRKILAACEDQSVIILAVGFFTAIEELFRSCADEYSLLDGYSLFKQKVKEVVSMGCADYPRTDNYNFNYNMDRVGAKAFFDKCHCPIIISPDGEDIIVGSSFSKKLPSSDPLRQAYEIYNGVAKGRSSWDLLCVAYACDKSLDWFKSEEHGQVVYDDSCNEVYWREGERKDSQIKLCVDHEMVAKELENILTKRC